METNPAAPNGDMAVAPDERPAPSAEPSESAPGAGAAPAQPPPGPQLRQAAWPEAFWKTATLFSFAFNFILLVVLLVAVTQIFQIKRAIAQPLVGGLHTSFLQMDGAHIVTTIQVNDIIRVDDTIRVNDSLPVVFDVPLSTDTTVVLTRDTPIPNTTVYLNGLPVPTDIVLPAGTPLDIHLNLIVPVSHTVPVALDVPVHLKVPVSLRVPVDIPLNQTDLHTPFTNLAGLVGPYDRLLNALPGSWGQVFAPQR